MHFMMMPWKLLFATIPPTKYLGGWATFLTSFILTGLLSFAVFDTVTSLGCLLDLHISLQALVLIAIGTNFPDCVANYLSSSDKNQMNADAALQMISATNAVNIFVGLGLPWTIATIYNWQQNGDDFYMGVQETEQITFVLILFFVCSMLAVLTLYIRRRAIGGELGGSRLGRIFSASFFFLLWGLCILLSGLYMSGNLGPYQVFTPSVAIKASAIGSCPEAIDEPLIYERNGDIGIRWTYP
jgi:magnesium/proton exchanger